MSNGIPLGQWDTAIAAYLSSRHALGRVFRKEERILNRFRNYLAAEGAIDIDQALFDQWRRQFRHCCARTRFMYEIAIFNFCRYRRRSEPSCFLPDRFGLARPAPYALPTLIDADQVARLLAYVATLPSTTRYPLRPAVLRFGIVLLYTAGLRRGEVARLTLGDIDTGTGVLRVHDSKFHKSRWVPLSDTAAQELHAYLGIRNAVVSDHSSSAPLLCTKQGVPYSGPGLSDSVRTIMIASGIWGNGMRLPRVHDFRHSFAVAALLRWYETDADVQSNLPKLALYMGHVSIVSTAYYLRFMPAVIAKAGERFARDWGTLVDGGTP